MITYIKNLIAPLDWRNRYFSMYDNYWGFYGPFNVQFDKSDAEIMLNGQWKPLPATIVVDLDQTNYYGDDTATEAPYGYVTYKNNGTTLNSDTSMRIKVRVIYGWGNFKTDWINVEVKKTI